MNNRLEELKKYFRETPREKVMSDWKATQKNFRRGPSVKEFLEFSHVKLKEQSFFVINEINDSLITPKYFGVCFL